MTMHISKHYQPQEIGGGSPVCEARPPLGLRPKYIADAMRAREILEAIDRYLSAGKKVPAEWIEELNDLVSE